MNDSTLIAEKSTHEVPIIQIKLNTHPNAESLSLVSVYDYSCCVRTNDWKDGDLAAWIPPDSEVDVSRPEFAFLGKESRIKAKRLRGIVSYGLLIKAPIGAKVDDNVADILGVTHWEPKINHPSINYPNMKKTSGEAAKPPSGVFYKYDIDAFLKYGRNTFIENELVAISEKLHGSSSRYICQNNEMFCGSRIEWKKEYASKPTITYEDLLKQFNNDEVKAKNVYDRILNWKPTKNLWWEVLDNTPSIRKFCEENPNFALYGEVYGQVQNLKYGTKQNEIKFAAFDILVSGKWLDFPEFIELCKKYEIPHVPILTDSFPFDFEKVKEFALGNSTIPGANHIREGCVVGPIKERWDDKLGRVKLKIINPAYYEKN